jgi:hypothetical protein
MTIRFYILTFGLLLFTIICNGQCPSASGLFTENYNFNSSSTSVEGHWNSMANTEVDHFILKYKKLDDQDWNNLTANDSAATSKIIGGLEFNTYYHWTVIAYCSVNQSDPAIWSELDTFLTMTYVDCPLPTNLFVDNIIVNESQGFADGNWDSMLGLGVDHFMLEFKTLQENDDSWTLLSNMDSTFTQRTMGSLELNSSYEWRVRSYCSVNQSYFSDWSIRDTFEIGDFIPQPFDPVVDLTISNQICEGLSNLSVTVSQTFNQPDIQFSSILSNSGSFEIFTFQEDDIIGEAYADAGNGFIQNDYDLVVNDIISDDKAEIALRNKETGFNDTYFNIENTGNGIKVLITSPNDQNSYTSGNTIDITFDEVFRNPTPSVLEFYFTVSSELNDNYSDQIDFLIECTSIIDDNLSFSIYPNPVSSVLNINLQGLKTIKLVNSLGEIVYEIITSKNIIDLSNVSDGFYVIIIDKGRDRIVEKLVIR